MELTKKRINSLRELRENPSLFSERILGNKLWSKEKEILEAIATYKYVAVGSGHKIGKTFTLADIVLWYLTCFPQSKVITTAPTGRQVKDLLWSEITSKYNKILHLIGGRGMQLRIEIDADWFAVGFKSEDYDPNAFQGYHSKSGHTLVIFDEACGIPKMIWEAAASIADKWIVAGNRLNALSNFEKCFTSPSWHSIIISSLESPNLTGEMDITGLANAEDIENWKAMYNEGSPLYQAHVLGECPHEGLDTLISLSLLERIRKKREEIEPVRPFFGGLDVAAGGADMSVLQVIDIKGQHISRRSWNKNITEIIGIIKKIMREERLKKIVIDADGLGLGVFQALADEFPEKIIAYHGSGKTQSPAYFNKRTEIWNWILHDLEDGELTAIQDVGFLFEDLSQVKQTINSRGAVQLEPKQNYKRRLGHSPDDGDAFVMADMARKLSILSFDDKETKKITKQFEMAEFADDLTDF